LRLLSHHLWLLSHHVWLLSHHLRLLPYRLITRLVKLHPWLSHSRLIHLNSCKLRPLLLIYSIIPLFPLFYIILSCLHQNNI
jgi:hypothetical protein